MRIAFALLLMLLWCDYANAQGAQCRTSPVGSSTQYCASEAFVTQSTAAAGNVTGPPSSTTGNIATFADTTGKKIQDGGAPATVTSVTCGAGLSGGTITTSGTCAVNLTTASNILSGDVAMGSIGHYSDGPSMAQGSTGTWWVSGQVTVLDTVGVSEIDCKLWDGTTVISSGSAMVSNQAASQPQVIALSGFLASPANNIRITCKDDTRITGVIKFNLTGNSKDSAIFGHRIQ